MFSEAKPCSTKILWIPLLNLIITEVIRHGIRSDGFVTLSTSFIKNVMTGLKGICGVSVMIMI